MSNNPSARVRALSERPLGRDTTCYCRGTSSGYRGFPGSRTGGSRPRGPGAPPKEQRHEDRAYNGQDHVFELGDIVEIRLRRARLPVQGARVRPEGRIIWTPYDECRIIGGRVNRDPGSPAAARSSVVI